MSQTETSRRWAVRAAITLAASAVLVVSSAVAANAAPTYRTLAAANIRLGASTSTLIVTTLPQGAPVYIDCYIDGQQVAGTTIWDHLADGTGYISDSLLYTGSDQPVVPRCGNAAPAPQAATGYDREAAVAYARNHWN